MPRNDERMDEVDPEDYPTEVGPGQTITYTPRWLSEPATQRIVISNEPSISGNRIVANLREEKNSCEARLAAINSLLSRLDGNPDLARMINDARDLGVLY